MQESLRAAASFYNILYKFNIMLQYFMEVCYNVSYDLCLICLSG